ncbi:hypothetical protein BGW36DRAFT_369478 [Talaromyces proteolyticus]|uniref:Luciferase domain-containing protein n=1 Tax=Talaromyces proteolyticus TaxID=1131652 RepID=A0AAD4Q4W1_9EURO|nr:uncharacterized protein BGW36DRAFT_369478 [Talaromyces proteolyticus]KAH8703534.1 hypothetical protein BGW36DRAFT_369478 [Talaromyces proteolyticus]
MSALGLDSINILAERLLASVRKNPLYSGLIGTGVLGSVWIINDYNEWVAFGTGGSPPNPFGYFRMTLLRIMFAYHIPNQTNHNTISDGEPSYLKTSIAPRAGGGPKMMPRILPQRQVPEFIDPSTENYLMKLVNEIGRAHPDLVEVKPSVNEGKTTDGIYARKENPKLNPLVLSQHRLDGEIAHAHPNDRSLHVWLSTSDARKVVEAGWGRRFPLPIVHAGWIMVYAPRTTSEMEVIEHIVKAGVRWVTGVAI